MSEGSKPPKAPPVVTRPSSNWPAVIVLSALSGAAAGGFTSISLTTPTASVAPQAASPNDNLSNDIDLLTSEIALTQTRVALLEQIPESIDKYSPGLVEHAVGEVDVRFSLGNLSRNADLFPFTDFHNNRLIKKKLITPAELKP
jgi:hypothetical protein